MTGAVRALGDLQQVEQQQDAVMVAFGLPACREEQPVEPGRRQPGEPGSARLWPGSACNTCSASSSGMRGGADIATSYVSAAGASCPLASINGIDISLCLWEGSRWPGFRGQERRHAIGTDFMNSISSRQLT
jgi:hypothetical protein